MSKISINYIGHSHNDWIRSLDFYKMEIGILKNRLTEIGGKNSNEEVSTGLEHFENQFLIQQVNMDALKAAIHEHIHEMSVQAAASQGHVDSSYRDQHAQLHEKYELQEKVVNDLRQEFNRFSATWM